MLVHFCLRGDTRAAAALCGKAQSLVYPAVESMFQQEHCHTLTKGNYEYFFLHNNHDKWEIDWINGPWFKESRISFCTKCLENPKAQMEMLSWQWDVSSAG